MKKSSHAKFTEGPALLYFTSKQCQRSVSKRAISKELMKNNNPLSYALAWFVIPYNPQRRVTLFNDIT